ncbi:MAG TPA: sigma-70 family RNA polymerase sigma factor [Dehalococcoidia bacterium]|nr:sigma-70 family RNA polymerase sigma factor [Dehalococcoidia bacterium]
MRRSNLQEADDSELIACAARGDREAFGALYERYVFRVFRHVYYLTSDPHTAEDLTAQTFLNALEAIPRYQMRGVPFLAWLLRIAYNLTVNHRKVRRNGTTQLPEGLEIEGTTYSPEASCEAKADGERVWEGVRRLRDDQRQVIVMRFIDGLSYPDIARVLGKSIGAVRVIQYRALCALRRKLEDDLGQVYAKSNAG